MIRVRSLARATVAGPCRRLLPATMSVADPSRCRSRLSQLPLFDAANRMNAYDTFLLMEQERQAP